MTVVRSVNVMRHGPIDCTPLYAKVQRMALIYISIDICMYGEAWMST